MKDTQKFDEIALNKYKLIVPVLTAKEEGADTAKLTLLKSEACEQSGVHRRTIER